LWYDELRDYHTNERKSTLRRATSEEAAFLRAIADNPDDDTARLVFADWLDEHDRPARAELIRVQCERASGRCDALRRTELLKRSMQLIQEYGRQWFLEDWPESGVNTVSGYTFDRGFVDQVSFARCGLRDADFARLLETCPLFSLVRVLNLSMNEIRDEGLRVLADCPRLARLRHLILSANPVTLEGIEYLAASSRLTSLTDLTLSHLVDANNLAVMLNLIALQATAGEAQTTFQRHGKNVRVRT
jgi:uncharacterized protein (TIGR02996 family)